MKILKFISLVFAIITTPAMASEIKVGKVAPDFELINQDGEVVKLSDYSGKNLVLTFSRAHW